jgi:uncharacterized membrane protein YbhN (UPF0104 family)
MTDNAADETGARFGRPLKSRGANKIALIALKIFITGSCFWYLSRQIDAASVASGIANIDLRWVAVATLLIILEMLLVAVRWRAIVNQITEAKWRAPAGPMIVIAAISSFFSQVLPSIAGEGVRSWLLVRLGCSWRLGITSVVIDRAVGVGLLLALTIMILLLPSGLSELGGFRDLVLAVYSASMLGAALLLAALPLVIPLLERHRYLRWAAGLMANMRRVLFGRAALPIVGLALIVHALTILAIWCIARAQGLMLPMGDAAVLFVVVVGVALVPISIGGWGVREVAVVTLLGRHGLPPEQALLFSVCFGLVLALASLPGGVAWLFYNSAQREAAAEIGG